MKTRQIKSRVSAADQVDLVVTLWGLGDKLCGPHWFVHHDMHFQVLFKMRSQLVSFSTVRKIREVKIWDLINQKIYKKLKILLI